MTSRRRLCGKRAKTRNAPRPPPVARRGRACSGMPGIERQRRQDRADVRAEIRLQILDNCGRVLRSIEHVDARAGERRQQSVTGERRDPDLKNSSRLFAAIARNFTRSSNGWESVRACPRTRSLKASQLNSRALQGAALVRTLRRRSQSRRSRRHSDHRSFAASSATLDRTTSCIVRCAKVGSPLNRSTTCTRPFDSASTSVRSI